MVYSSWIILVLCLSGLVSSEDNCIAKSCYPTTGDLLVGRGDQLYASSTCGLNGRAEEYCVISSLKPRGDCSFWCDSRPGDDRFSHLPKDVVIDFQKKQGKDTWWQSENGKEDVYLQLDFNAQFHVTHIVMQWRSFRPAAMLIERSYDYKKTWHVSRYYAKDCQFSFPGVPVSQPDKIDAPYCTSEYSRIEPSTRGEVVYKVLTNDISREEAESVEVQNLLRMTNIRINFTKLNTLGDDIIGKNLETNKKYYYALDWLSIRGSCSCYGHAEQCLPANPKEKAISNMVYSVCNCTHNTAGINCERCKEGYNDLAWKPSYPEKPFVCKKCDCHEHSDKCEFNPAVFEASGRRSGGVCIDCQHNTIGTKCERCKPLHYQDPNLSIRDPNVCKPCDCDPVGSVGRGECQMEDDPINNLRAGDCICKENVDGVRCDRCKDGFFNLKQDSLKGCEACGCDVHGTRGKSCDTITGICRCKIFVEGEKCDKCVAGYWDLQSGAGCKPCECDLGGAYHNFCDFVTGQCRCRPGIEGRKCDRVIPGFYYALSDNLKYEAEDARGIGLTSVNFLERPQGTPVVWTDMGSLNITEGNGVEFVVTNVPMTGNYKILMRFYPKALSSWEEVKVSVSRADGQGTINGVCGNALSSNGYTSIITVGLYQQTKLLDDMVCLEKGVHYFVRVDFDRHQGRVNNINLDSLVLIPDMSSVSIFEGDRGRSRLDQFTRYYCERTNLPANVPRPTVNPVCRKLHFSGSAVIYDGALSCDCDQVGTIQNASGIYSCDDAGGQCPCKPNVIGRRCRKCAPGTYKFGENGCTPCACDLRGSFDNLCDAVSGQCKCNGLGIGRQCNECPTGQWGFPRCRPCECNNHASTCHSVTGVCINCIHNTAGDHCELCKAGYFGDATKGTSTDCQQCQCPGGSSENQFSPTCKVDTSTSPPSFICDQCPLGYEGKLCQECSDGYYGNPLIPGGKCEKCNCSGNVNFADGGGCDKSTGECIGCLYNTAGDFCHVCKPGFYGNAKNQTCRPCSCSVIGTDVGAGECDSTTGQCQCKPNVVGLSCDRCAPGHWDLASGDGCKSCGCCADGSTSAQCDQISGVCECLRDFGGPKCCECEEGFWGVPPGECAPCDCNPSGSLHSQCNRKTGECVCKPGVTGKKCNKCELETTQEFPECEACHDCYYSWDKIISELEEIAFRLKGRGSGGSGGPVSVDYEKELDALNELVRRIEYILGNRTTYPKHVEDIQTRIEQFREKIMEIMDSISAVDKDLDGTESKMNNANEEIIKLRNIYERLKILIEGQFRNLTNLQFTKPRESYNETLRIREVSTEAAEIANDVRKIVEDSQNIRNGTQLKLPRYEGLKDKHHSEWQRFLIDIINLKKSIEIVNRVLCGEDCGGCNATGCNPCGGEGCDGAVPLAELALNKAKQAERALWKKERDANATFLEVIEARKAVDNAMKEAKIALELAKNNTNYINGLIEEINKLLNRSGADLDEVRRIAEYVLGRNLSISEEEIKELGDRIKKAVQKLTGIDQILKETTLYLGNLNSLKEEAIQANISASDAAKLAKEVKTSLDNVRDKHDGLNKSLKKAKRTIEVVEIKLLEVEIRINETLNKSIESVRLTTEMKTRLSPLEDKFKKNEELLKKAEKEVKEAVDISSTSKTNSKDAKEYYDEVMTIYNDKLNNLTAFKKRSDEVLKSAKRVKTSLTTKLRDIKNYVIRWEELDDLTKKLEELQNKTEDKFCEIVWHNKVIQECRDESSLDDIEELRYQTTGKFCDEISK